MRATVEHVPSLIGMRKTMGCQTQSDRHTNIGLRMSADVIEIAMGSARSGRDLSEAQNEALRPLVQRAIEIAGGKQVALARAIGWDQATISGFINRRQGTSFAVAEKICAMVGADLFEVLGLKNADGAARPDPKIGPFLMQLRRLPGLERWVESNPTKYTVTEIATAMAVYDRDPPRAQSDGMKPGEPLGGWDHFIADAVRVGVAPIERIRDQQIAGEAVERSQMSSGGRKRLRSASKKT